jgi:hypothetical protein
MTITLPPGLAESVLKASRERGQTPEQFVFDALHARLHPMPKRTADEIMAELRSLAVDAGVSLTDEQVSRECIYED